MLARPNKVFRLVLIKPSHYDNDGYVIRWWRGGLPSNSLACLYGIAEDCRERKVLGADYDIDIDAIDALRGFQRDRTGDQGHAGAELGRRRSDRKTLTT